MCELFQDRFYSILNSNLFLTDIQWLFFVYFPAATMTVPHRANKDTTLGGYNIPKDTIVLCNLYAALRDPKCWDFPDEFFPERFLTAEGKPDPEKQKYLIPFGVGKWSGASNKKYA